MKVSTTRIIVEIIAALSFLFLPLLIVPVVSPLANAALLQPVLLGVIIIHSALILLYYWNYYYAIPQLYFKGRKRTFGLISLTFFVALCFIACTDTAYNPFPDPPFRYPVFIFLLSVLLRFTMIMFVSFAFASFTHLRKTEEARLRSELSYLRAQINPHFLFNTLNSLYALTVTRSDKAPAAITKLSSIMRYVIDEASADLVPLTKELDYTTAYIELEKLRLNEKVKLSYSINGDPDTKKIAPLLLLPLVENTFRHGVSAREKSEINIVIDIGTNELKLATENTLLKTGQNSGTGLGLANVKKRLELIYPGRYAINVTQKDSWYNVELKIQLR